MRRTWLLGTVVATWLTAMCLPAQAVLLRYTPKVGAVAKSKQTMTGKIQVTAAGQTMTGSMSSQVTYVQKVVEQVPEGRKVETTARDGTMTMAMGGQEGSSTPQKLPDFTAVTILDDRGRLVKLVSTDLESSQGPINKEFLGQLGGTAQLPEEEVSPGSTWTDSIKTDPSGITPGMDLTLDSRLLDLVTYEGRKCAKISTALSGPLSMDLAEATKGAGVVLQGSIHGDMQGRMVGYYDYEHSVWVSLGGNVTATTSIEPEGETAGLGAMTTKMSIHIAIALVTKPAAKVTEPAAK